MRRPKEKDIRSWRKLRRDTPSWLLPLVTIEWATEHLVHLLKQWAFVDLVSIVAGLSLVWAAVSYISSADERRRSALDQQKAKHYQAWQVIALAEGKKADGGRSDALRDLLNDGVSLAGLNLSEAIFARLNLGGARLTNATLRNAQLDGACLRKAILENADLSHSQFKGADFSFAQLLKADMRYSSLIGASFDRAFIENTDLRYSILPVEIRTARSFGGTNIYGVQIDDAAAFVNWALANGAVCVASEQWKYYTADPAQEKTTADQCGVVDIESDDMYKGYAKCDDG